MISRRVKSCVQKVLAVTAVSACVALSTVLGLGVTSTFAQAPSGPTPGGAGAGPPTGPLTVHPVASNAYWVEGGVGNTGFVVGDKGVIVIDATISPASAQELLAAIAKVTPKPVTDVIITHGDIDHTAGLAAFPAGVTIYAQEATRARMAAGVAAGRSRIPADHIPNRGVQGGERLILQGVPIQLLHWAPAHTDGDLIAYFPGQKVVFTGDIFALDQPRAAIHPETGGTSGGWIATAQNIVALDSDRFVVGHGDLQTKASLAARIKLVVDETAQIKVLAAQGKSLAEIQAAVGDPPLGQVLPGPGGPRFTAYSKIVYDELNGSTSTAR